MASLVALCIGPLVLFKVYGISLNMMEIRQEQQEIAIMGEIRFGKRSREPGEIRLPR